jgi:hypothetical protein
MSEYLDELIKSLEAEVRQGRTEYDRSNTRHPKSYQSVDRYLMSPVLRTRV